jgi:LysR family cys regulon transcriptional activator
LGERIFARTKNSIHGLTPQGEEILRIGQRMLLDARSMRQVAGWSRDSAGELRIATTHVHARYVLPRVIQSFSRRYPKVLLGLQQCDPLQCCTAVAEGEADIAVTIIDEQHPDARIVAIPTFTISAALFVPRRHPLARERALTLKKIADYPLISYSSAFAFRAVVDKAFAEGGLQPHMVCTATDADVCKTYVEHGLGVAILARIAYDSQRDAALSVLEVDRLFPPRTLNLVFRRNAYLGGAMEAFVEMLAPHVQRQGMQARMNGSARASTERDVTRPLEVVVSEYAARGDANSA